MITGPGLFREVAIEARKSYLIGIRKELCLLWEMGSQDHLFDDVDTGSHHGRSDKRDAEEDVLLNGSSPRSELKDPEHRHSLHELIGQDEDPEKG